MKSDKMAEIGLSRRHKMSHHYLSTPIINQVSNIIIFSTAPIIKRSKALFKLIISNVKFNEEKTELQMLLAFDLNYQTKIISARFISGNVSSEVELLLARWEQSWHSRASCPLCLPVS